MRAVDRLPQDLLGRHVERRPHEVAGPVSSWPCACLARPKSMIFGSPEGRRMMFAGLMSRWTTPLPVRVGERLRHPRHECRAPAARGDAVVGEDLRERLALEALEGDEEHAALGIAVDVVDHDDAGMGEARGDARLGEEAPLEGLAAPRPRWRRAGGSPSGPRPGSGRGRGPRRRRPSCPRPSSRRIS